MGMKPLPEDCLRDAGCSLEDAKEFIRKNIKDRSNAYIFSMQYVIDFLEKIGPDTSVNAFSCNFKQKGEDEKWHLNNNVDRFNEYNECIYQQSSHENMMKDDTKRMIKRIPLILTKSEKDCEIFGQSLDFTRSTLGLDDTKTKEKFTLLINSVMNPIQTSEGHISSIEKRFRETAIICAEKMNEFDDIYNFLVIGKVSNDGEFFVEYVMPNENSVGTKNVAKIQAIISFKLTMAKHYETINQKMDEDHMIPIILSTKLKQPKQKGNKGLYDIAFGKRGNKISCFDVYKGFPTAKSSPFLKNVEIISREVLYYKSAQDFWKPKKKITDVSEMSNVLRYFLFGTATQSFMTKIKSGFFPNPRHVLELSHHLTSPPLDEKVIRLGVEVKIIHPDNVLINRQNWEDPFYTPLIVEKQEGDEICSDAKTDLDHNNELYLNGSCLVSMRARNRGELEPYLIEFPRPFRKSRVPTMSPYIVTVYGKRDIFHEI